MKAARNLRAAVTAKALRAIPKVIVVQYHVGRKQSTELLWCPSLHDISTRTHTRALAHARTHTNDPGSIFALP